MKEKDLIELLRSTIESDALVSRLYNLYHITYKYSLQELDTIIDYGIQNGYIEIENVDEENVKYNKIEWHSDNRYQEVLMVNKDKYIENLFVGNGTVPNDFRQFIDDPIE